MVKRERTTIHAWLLPAAVFLAGLAIWWVTASLHLFPESAFPNPPSVLVGFLKEARTGRLFDDLIASLYRVSLGFVMAVASGVPMGLWLGHHLRARQAFLPAVNFFRNLSPLAWIPFAILWFGVGDAPAVFLIFLSVFFPVVLAVTSAVASIPSVYFHVARDYGFKGLGLVTDVTLPAIMPQVITTLRVTAGVAWMVVVAAEMVAGSSGGGGQHGLGFAIWDARNGLRTDLIMEGMIVIGIIGLAIDHFLARLTRMPSVRWGYER